MFDAMNEASTAGEMPGGAMSGEALHGDMTGGAAVDDMPSGAVPMQAMQPGGTGGHFEGPGNMPRGAMMASAGGDAPGGMSDAMSDVMAGATSNVMAGALPGELSGGLSGGMPGEADAGGAMTEVRAGNPGMGMGAGDMTNGSASGQMPGPSMGMGAAMDPTAVVGLDGPGGMPQGRMTEGAGPVPSGMTGGSAQRAAASAQPGLDVSGTWRLIVSGIALEKSGT